MGVRAQLWDIAGQDRFQKLTRAYFANAKAVVIVCDVSREGTIEAVQRWKEEVDRCAAIGGLYWDPTDPTCNHMPRLPVVLLANKADLLQNASQAFKLGATMERMCAELGFMRWWICSARTGEAVQDAFSTLLTAVVRQEAERDPAHTAAWRQRNQNGAFRLHAVHNTGTGGAMGTGEEHDDDTAVRLMDCC